MATNIRDNAEAQRFGRIADRCAPPLIGLVVLGLYFLLPKAGDILNTDASRHALNGAFLLDFVRAMPLSHPIDYAMDYYRQWPALTILFYPPLFYAPLAVSYAIFGVSEAAALVAELAALFLLGWGAYVLSRNWLTGLGSLAVALLLVGAPDVYFWGQQVMLDVPAYMWLMWAAVFHVRYLRGEPARWFYVTIVCVVAAIYTKYNAIFFAAVMALSLLQDRGWRFAVSRMALRGLVLGVVLLVPLLVIFFKFSTYNLSQAGSIEDAGAARWSLRDLTYYLWVLPDVLSWPTVGLAAVYGLAVPFLARLRVVRPDAVFLLLWAGLGLAFYTMIALKEPRHILFITYPIVLAAVLAVERLPVRAFLGGGVALVVAVCVLAGSAVTRPPPYITGMREATQTIASIAPADSNVAFWGKLDGTFIFAMRAYTGRRDLGVVRLDKLLLSGVAVTFSRGFTEQGLTADQIATRLHDLHVQYVVMQSDYEQNIDAIRTLDSLLHSNKFQEVQRIKMTANYPFSYLTEMVIYRAVEDVPKGRILPSVELKLIGRNF